MSIAAEWSVFWLNVFVYALLVPVRMQVDVWLPDACFDPNRWWFRTRDWERDGDVYRDRLRIDRWKDRLPTVTSLNRFSKRRLAGNDQPYLERFVLETCRAESNHVRAILSVVVMQLWTPPGVWVICFLLAFSGNLPFILIQRHNRPRLQRALERIAGRTLPRSGEPDLQFA
mgnify:CR=1 FL=1